MSETKQPIPPADKDLIAKAIVEVDENVDELGHGPSYEDVAEESGVGLEAVKQYVHELADQGIVKLGTLGGGDEEFSLTPNAKKWRKRLGLDKPE